MRVAVVGSRTLTDICAGPYLPAGTTEIISGGARGADAAARAWAEAHGLPLREILPDYRRWGRYAPIRRNDEIVAAADYVVALWDGVSRGTAYVIRRCLREGKALRLVVLTRG